MAKISNTAVRGSAPSSTFFELGHHDGLACFGDFRCSVCGEPRETRKRCVQNLEWQLGLARKITDSVPMNDPRPSILRTVKLLAESEPGGKVVTTETWNE